MLHSFTNCIYTHIRIHTCTRCMPSHMHTMHTYTHAHDAYLHTCTHTHTLIHRVTVHPEDDLSHESDSDGMDVDLHTEGDVDELV